MDISKRGEAGGSTLDGLDSLQVLDADALVILGSASEDFSVEGAVGREGWVGPLAGLGGDGIEMGIEENRGERRVGAEPSE